MHTFLMEQTQNYTGRELSSHWIYSQTGLAGNALLAFRGPCQVNLTDLVDLADVRANAPIYSENMLHFLLEHFQADLCSMVLRQRLLTCLIQSAFHQTGQTQVQRQGDDLYDGPAKLSVSIATVSPVSGLIHFGINLSSHNTPVLTKGLDDYGINWQTFAQNILNAYQAEEQSVQQALVKVRWVH